MNNTKDSKIVHKNVIHIDDYNNKSKSSYISKSDMLNAKGIENYVTNVLYESFYETHSIVLNDDVMVYLLQVIYKNKEIVRNLNKLIFSDKYTYKHSINTAILSILIGMLLKLNNDKLVEIAISGLLHDIGKSNIPIAILNKEDSLTEQEFIVIKKHCEYGYAMIKDSKNLSENIKEGILSHHEKIDGKGYPRGLRGDNISLYARILSVADVYDALVSDRPYHKPCKPKRAIEMMLLDEGKFDDNILCCFVDYINKRAISSDTKEVIL